MTQNIEFQLILARLDALTAKIDAQSSKIDDIKVNMGLSATTTRDMLTKVIHDEVATSTASAKEKKKVAASESKTEEKKQSSAKKTHPSLTEVTEKAWDLKANGDDFEKRTNWFISVLSKHPTHLHAIIGPEEVARVINSPEYKALLAQQKKQGVRESAKVFIAALKTVRTAEGSFVDISQKLVADYDAQLAILNSQKIGQLTAETAGVVEAAAAAALSGLVPVVTIHQTAATVSTTSTGSAPSGASTVAPSAQLAQLQTASS